MFGLKELDNRFIVMEQDDINVLSNMQFKNISSLHSIVNYIKSKDKYDNKKWCLIVKNDTIVLSEKSNLSKDELKESVFESSLSIVASALYNEYELIHRGKHHYNGN